MAIRSGRFKSTDAADTKKLHIISGHAGAFYRIFNSGDYKFTVHPNGDGSGTPANNSLAPTFSIDVYVAGGGVYIEGDETKKSVEGIYDFLTESASVRSGRFNRQLVDNLGQPVNPSTPHKIIDLKGGTKDAWYRIFNSGYHPIKVLEGTNDIATIAPDQSFDFEIKGKDISVKSEANTKPIEGIYEFLGRDS